MSQIADERISKHSSAILFFDSLIVDLKLVELGHEPIKPVTLERLEQASRHIQDIQRCTEPVLRWHGIGTTEGSKW